MEVSDSEDEGDKKSKKSIGQGKGKGRAEDADESEDEDADIGKKEETAEDAVKRISSLATTKVSVPCVRFICPTLSSFLL